jgi:hypothetical protein
VFFSRNKSANSTIVYHPNEQWYVSLAGTSIYMFIVVNIQWIRFVAVVFSSVFEECFCYYKKNRTSIKRLESEAAF